MTSFPSVLSTHLVWRSPNLTKNGITWPVGEVTSDVKPATQRCSATEDLMHLHGEKM